MKLSTLTAHLVALLRLPASDMTELIRTFKDGSSHWTNAEDDLAAALSGKPGPRGGVDATDFNVAFLLIGLMIDGPRKNAVTATYSAYHLDCEGTVSAGWVDDGPLPPAVLCPLTGESMFGPALKKVLADEDLARRVDMLRVRSDSRAAEIHFDDGRVSRFCAGRQNSSQPLVRIAQLDGELIATVAALLLVSE
jgi:hypothetical protein